MVVEDEQLAAWLERAHEPARPGVEIGEIGDHALGRVDEIEAPAPQLRRQRGRVRLDPEDLRPPLARLVEPDDIAGAVSFLCSDDAAMMCGQTLVVDGGYSLPA